MSNAHDLDGELAAAAASYRYFDADHTHVVNTTLRWLAQTRLYTTSAGVLDPTETARRAYVSGTYAYFTAPPDARRSLAFDVSGDPLHAMHLASIFLVVVFLADDLRTAEERRTLGAFARKCAANPKSEATTPGAEATRAVLAQFALLSDNTSSLCDSFARMCESFATELEIPPSDLDEGTYAELRDTTIGVPAFTTAWEHILGLRIPKDERLRLEPLRRLASQLIYIVDDITSLPRDAGLALDYPQDVADPNLLLIIARTRGISTDEAKRAAASIYNSAVAQFEVAQGSLRASGSPAITTFVNMMARMVNGNLISRAFLQGARCWIEPELALLRQVSEPSWFHGPTVRSDSRNYGMQSWATSPASV